MVSPGTCAADNLLLIGAGFSKDFGGMLATEVWSTIFNDSNVRRLPSLIRRVEASSPDFEAVYQEVVGSEPESDEGRVLHRAVLDAYERLDRTIRDPFGGCHKIDMSRLRELIRLFAPRSRPSNVGFVFSLNQDLLPERRMICASDLHGPTLPGFPPLPGHFPPYLENGEGAKLTRADVRLAPAQDVIDGAGGKWVSPGNLHWIKLHGSQNWRDSSGRGLMVIGNRKAAKIREEPILRWYWSLFEAALLSGRHRLVVIGYSFRDSHVNDLIERAVRDVGLVVIVIDPTPWGRFREQLSDSRNADQWPGILGAVGRGQESRYLEKTILELFPYSTYGSETQDWRELKALLREPLT